MEDNLIKENNIKKENDVVFEVKNVNLYYDKGAKHALKDINMKIYKNKVTAFIGPSGCGKSTLLRCINGLEEYNAGSIKVYNREIKDLSGKELRESRKDIGMIFQNFNLIEHITVLKNVEISLTLSNVNYKERRKIALNALKKVGLDKYANNPSFMLIMSKCKKGFNSVAT